MAAIYSLLSLVSMGIVWTLAERRFWVLVVCLACSLAYVVYQSRFLIAGPLDRPLGYKSASSVLFVLDLLAHLAVALACGIGAAGIGALVFGYFMAGQAARAFAEKTVRSKVRGRSERKSQDYSAE